MTHRSERSKRLTVEQLALDDGGSIRPLASQIDDVCIVILPLNGQGRKSSDCRTIERIVGEVLPILGIEATLIVVGEPFDLVQAHMRIADMINYQLWIAIKRPVNKHSTEDTELPRHHFGASVYTKYSGSLEHTKTRLRYTYCPSCGKTTKDYGGKKHTYDSYGTLISDVWRDICVELEGDLSPVIDRFADLFGISKYRQIFVLDLRNSDYKNVFTEVSSKYVDQLPLFRAEEHTEQKGQLIQGDALRELRNLRDDSVDFVFADPPYNLHKKYNSYSDDLSISEYFAWCDSWLDELVRILRPGRTCAILNIPLWSIRHFMSLEGIAQFQNWIAWDALSFPVRQIMPAHYAILCFSKGMPRPLPGFNEPKERFSVENSGPAFQPLDPLGEGFCLRAQCVRSRQSEGVVDRGPLTDLWFDVHRLKHNSRRVDHPCQLPPQLMYRLISIFTAPGETVLDCFNGAGTTTLAAHQLGRQYIGIELSSKYHEIAATRHREVSQGIDPFRRAKRKLTEKNSKVERLPEQTYKIPKKTLQLEIRRISQELDRIPTRDEVIKYARYPIEYYDNYFVSWGEVCAAARHSGMTEERASTLDSEKDFVQMRFV